MHPLVLHDFHAARGAAFAAINGMEVVADYGNWDREYATLTTKAGLIDLSARGRVVLLGADRQKMLNGQVTNNVKDLKPGEGCYAALVNAKARMLSDLNIYALRDELLLDFEPGFTGPIVERLERFIIAEDVHVVDAAPHYGLISLQGPDAGDILRAAGRFAEIPQKPLTWVSTADADGGEIYLMRQERIGGPGFDLFVPNAAIGRAMEGWTELVERAGGGCVGWNALEVARIEAGLPRFGADMDETQLAPETGISDRAISYTKGCYSGQEVIARIRTYGQVAKALRGLRLSDGDDSPPTGTRLFRAGKDVGYLTSVVRSPALNARVALGYVRKECNAPGNELAVGTEGCFGTAVVVDLPFVNRGAR